MNAGEIAVIRLRNNRKKGLEKGMRNRRQNFFNFAERGNVESRRNLEGKALQMLSDQIIEVTDLHG